MNAEAATKHFPLRRAFDIEYQHMTDLPEAQERALVAKPMGALLEAVGWLGASDKYHAVQQVARTMPEKALAKFLATNHAPDQIVAKAARVAPEATPEAPKASRAPKAPTGRGRLDDRSIVTRTKGNTKIQSGSLRQKVLDALAAASGSATLGELSTALGQDAKPVVAKLREAGWVTVGEAS